MKPSRIALALAVVGLPLIASTVSANQSLVSPGYSATTGGVTTQRTVHTSSHNPASLNLLTHKNENLRFGYLGNLGVYAEVGEVDDLDTKLDQLVDDLDELDALGSSATAAQYQDIADRINGEFLNDLERGGQIRAGVHVSAPLMPFIYSSKTDWSLGFNVSASAQVRGAFLGSPFGVKTTITSSGADLGSLNIQPENIGQAYEIIDNAVDAANGNYDAAFFNNLRNQLDTAGVISTEDFQTLQDAANAAATDPGAMEFDAELTTDSSFDVRAAAVAQFSLAYAHDLTSAFNLNPNYGTLEAGARLNYYHTQMFRNLASFQRLSDDDEDDAFDTVMDDFTDESVSAGVIGIDAGLLWHGGNYQLGATFYNLNEPTLDYPDLESFLQGKDLAVAQSLQASGRLNLAESVTLTRHAVLEAAVFSESRNWVLQGYYTLGTATNFVGDEFQNVGVSAGYFTNSWWLPGIRAGYNKNLTGTELSTVHLGTTLFGMFNLDAAVSPETSSFDGSDVPRYVAISIGFEEKF